MEGEESPCLQLVAWPQFAAHKKYCGGDTGTNVTGPSSHESNKTNREVIFT